MPAVNAAQAEAVCNALLEVWNGRTATEQFRNHVRDCLQGSFQKLIKGLQSLDYSILDVNSHRWHDDYNKFKAGIKDLEVMLTNVIQLAFENASSLVGRVELLEVRTYCLWGP